MYDQTFVIYSERFKTICLKFLLNFANPLKLSKVFKCINNEEIIYETEFVLGSSQCIT